MHIVKKKTKVLERKDFSQLLVSVTKAAMFQSLVCLSKRTQSCVCATLSFYTHGSVLWHSVVSLAFSF